MSGNAIGKPSTGMSVAKARNRITPVAAHRPRFRKAGSDAGSGGKGERVIIYYLPLLSSVEKLIYISFLLWLAEGPAWNWMNAVALKLKLGEEFARPLSKLLALIL